MRLAQLLGKEIVDRSGRSLGQVHDVRLVRDGPEIGGFGAAFRIHSLVAGSVAVGSRLGLGRTDVKGPWPLKAVMAWLHDDLVSIHWEELWSIEEETIRVRVTVPDGEHHVGPHHGPVPGEVVDAALQLLDRQIVDAEGKMSGKVDDLDLVFGGDTGKSPIVDSILAGPGALSHRLGGRLGAWLDSAHRRLSEDVQPPSISFGVVKRIGNHLDLSVPRRELETMKFERWTRERIVDRIPGA